VRVADQVIDDATQKGAAITVRVTICAERGPRREIIG
jgi:hypothetical protein